MTLAKRAGQLGAVILLIAIVIRMANPVIGVAIQETRTSYDDTVVIADGTGQLDESIGLTDLSVQQSLDNTVKFSGASDSELTGTANITHDDTWTVTTWARLDPSVQTSTAQQRVLRLGGFLYVSYNASEWRAVYYDDTTLNSYAISINATSPTTWTHLSVQSNGSHLMVYRNDTTRTVVPLADGSQFNGSYITSNLHGTVEESRVYDDNITDANRSTVYSTPTAPLPGANETARIYYDRYPGETSVDVFRTGSDLSASNVTTVDGFQGQGASDGTDYTRQGGTLSALDGGTLDGAPAAFAEYTAVGIFGGAIGKVVSIGGAALGVVIVGLLLVAYQAIAPLLTGF